jgi:anti-sigma factor (TIGR02949 family)
MTKDLDPQLSCEDVVRSLWEYLDGELDDVVRDRIRDHLAECEHCHGQFTFESAFLRAVERLIEQPVATVSLRARIVAELRAQGFREN